jgi:tetratricopeptide (TPR) repeat protein
VNQTTGQNNWRRLAAIVVASLLVLGALIALRGPDPISAAAAELAGSWLVSGPSLWHPLTASGAPTAAMFAAAGPRGWQNAHVLVAWLAVLCWFLSLPDKSWRGLGPLVPGLLAVVLSGPASGWSGFGLAVLLLSFWRTATMKRTDRDVVVTFALAAWLAVWISPGAILVVVAAAAECFTRLPRKMAILASALAFVASMLTPYGAIAWVVTRNFVFWSPQAGLDLSAVTALLFALVILSLAAGAAWRTHARGPVIAPAFLLLGASAGQTALLWPAALWLIPLWAPAVEQWRHIGFRFRWWMQAASILLAAILLVAPAKDAMPRWYSLAMTDAAVRPTLTRAALPANGPVYINPSGLPVARLSGPLPRGANSELPTQLGREPSLWRAHDRETRYAAAWLLGDKSDYAPLARHLGESPDWRLAAVDATGVLFVRAPRVEPFATEPAQQAAREMWGGANRSAFLSGSALACLAANALPEAGELSAAAVRNSDLSATAAATRARVLISLGDVRGALELSERTLDLDATLPLAWEVRTEALLHASQSDDAYAAAQRAAALAPGDEGALWLAARAANAARAFQTEAELLERLIALTTARGGDSSFYRLYLGQSYAKQGLARPALRELEQAAAAPDISAEQRLELEDELKRIRSNPATQ